jgi:hypothetical protein
MRLGMERGTTSILQYQLPAETILTHPIGWSSLAPDRWSENKHPGTSLLPSFTFIHAAFQVKQGTIFPREARLQPNSNTRG